MFPLLLLFACAGAPQAPRPADADRDGVPDQADCAPGDPAVHPGALDFCDHGDNDCDGQVDEDATVSTWYADWDADDYGDAAEPIRGCDPPDDAVLVTGDCDPNDGAAHPGAPERCNGRDDDCDGSIDEEPRDRDDWYHDTDGDGWGDAATVRADCDDPGPAWIQLGGDCDDTDAAVHPEALERCAPPGLDDDCDGDIDEDGASGGTAWYLDEDGDGAGAGAPRWGCAAHRDESAAPTDCDDADPLRFPGASERCDGMDEDCDGRVDDEAVDAAAWFTDGDADGYGDPGTRRMACTAPSGTVSRGDDCDDGDASVHPNAEEDCALAVDYNCDGRVGTDDADGDGFGACAECDDGDAGVYPGAFETCDAVDEDCDGEIDVGAPGYVVWHPDADLDGYGDDGNARGSCDPVPTWVASGNDCDDTDDAVHPGATESCGSAADDDCDGEANERDATYCRDYGTDTDGDGEPSATDTACLCAAGGPYAGLAGADCDDDDPERFPGADDSDCDGRDLDCNGFDCDVPAVATVGTGSYQMAVTQAWDVDDGVWIAAPYPSPGFIGLYRADGRVEADSSVARVSGSVATEYFTGLAVRDVTGDGADDLFIASGYADWSVTNAGSVYFVPGPITGDTSLDDVATARWDGGTANDYAGVPFFSDDLSGDGVADGWITVSYDDEAGTSAGAVAHIDLSLTGVNALDDAGIRLLGEGPGGRFGAALVAPGDLSGDGVDDLAVGAPDWNDPTTGDNGAVYVFEGPLRTSTLAADADARWTADGVGFGALLLDGGDADGDGVLDLWARGEDRWPCAKLYLLPRPGDGGGTPADALATVSSRTGTGEYATAAVGSLDLDDSGAPDLLVTDPRADSDEPQTGLVSIYLDPIGSVDLPDISAAGRFRGRSVGEGAAPLVDWGPDAVDTAVLRDAAGYAYVLDLAEFFP